MGVPTKWLPAVSERAYFRDSDFEKVKPEIDAAFLRAVEHLRSGGGVVLPRDGLGTGLAELPQRAPRIHGYISRCVTRLYEIAASR